MKSFLFVLGLCLVLSGCKEREGTWSGWLAVDETLTVLEGDQAIQIPPGVELTASLVVHSDATLRLQGAPLEHPLDLNLPPLQGSLSYGKTLQVKDFGQPFTLIISPELKETVQATSSRYEACSDYMYHCGWQWKDGEYKHVCEHQMIYGQQKIDYQTTDKMEVLKISAQSLSGLHLADLYLSRSMGASQKVLTRHRCEPFF